MEAILNINSLSTKISYIFNIIFIFVIINGVQNFFLLKDTYEKNMNIVLEKITVIENELINCANKSVSPPNKNVEALREYIAAKFPKIPGGDIVTISNEVSKQCLANSIPFSVIVGMIEVESAFKRRAKSKMGAYGLMQIKYDIWKEELNLKNKKELFNIKKNISIGINILKCYLDKNDGDIIEALKDYAGSNNKILIKRVNQAMGEFTMFRTAYVNNSELNINKERITANASDCKIGKHKKQHSPKLGKRKRLPSSPIVQHKHKVVHG